MIKNEKQLHYSNGTWHPKSASVTNIVAYRHPRAGMPTKIVGLRETSCGLYATLWLELRKRSQEASVLREGSQWKEHLDNKEHGSDTVLMRSECRNITINEIQTPNLDFKVLHGLHSIYGQCLLVPVPFQHL